MQGDDVELVNRLRNLLDLVVVLVLLTGLQAILAGIIAVRLPALLSCALHAAAAALQFAFLCVMADGWLVNLAWPATSAGHSKAGEGCRCKPGGILARGAAAWCAACMSRRSISRYLLCCWLITMHNLPLLQAPTLHLATQAGGGELKAFSVA